MTCIFIDIDGTLIGYLDHKVPSSALEAIKQARENDHKVFLCTGRPISQTKQYYTENFDGVVCSAGGLVIVGNETIHEVIMENEDVQSLIQLFEVNDVGFILEGRDSNYCSKEGQEVFLEMIKAYDEHAKMEDVIENLGLSSYENYVDDVVYKISFYTKNEEQIKRIGKAAGEQFQVVYTVRGEGKIIETEMFYKGCNKAEGIKKVVALFNDTIDHAIGFGDSMNDYEMIQECGVGVAMGNACDTLKKVANHVTTNVMDDGIYNAFKKLGLIK